MKLVPTDLSEVVAVTIKSLGTLPGVTVTLELATLPRVRLDQDQFPKVLTNLILNAKDAVNSNGQVRVQTGRSSTHVFLTVTDNGVGMTPEFMEKSLFRPFRTTKKNGLGIGMFHSKMIVEAHQGKLEVESELGHGSVFRVLFPLDSSSS